MNQDPTTVDLDDPLPQNEKESMAWYEGEAFDLDILLLEQSKNFDDLAQLIKDKQVRSEGVILVEHDADGQVRVTQTGDHMGRKGLG